MKQITIYEFLKKNKGVIKDGWVAMNKDENWVWFKDCPKKGCYWYGRFEFIISTGKVDEPHGLEFSVWKNDKKSKECYFVVKGGKMSNYDGKIEPLPTYHNQGAERYLSSDKPDTYLWLAEENTKQAKQIERLQEQLNEANDVIKKYAEFNNWEGDDKNQHDMTHFVGEDIGCGWSLATDYLEKWGAFCKWYKENKKEEE